jgi:hypothetical protein
VDENRKPGGDGAGDPLKGSPHSGESAPDESKALPRGVRRRLEASADAWVDASTAATPGHPGVMERIIVNRKAQRRGWYVAAACFLLAVAGWWPRVAGLVADAAHGISPLQAEAERGREHLLRTSHGHLRRWTWSHESGLEADVSGEVVWDGQRQQGYLTVTGLPPNAESGRQYQLWIFDGSRDDRYPVDGGVFDVAAGSHALTIPIRPALKVARPVVFAVTLEPAGGVVVSDRRHLMALARASTR